MTASMAKPATFSLVRDLSTKNEMARAANAPPQAAPRTSAASLLAINITAMPDPMNKPPYVARTSEVPSRPGICSPIVRLTSCGQISPRTPARMESAAPP
jgi:hypothetical protein